MKNKELLPTEKQVAKFKMLNELLESIYIEVKEFSKKKPDDVINKFKVKSINRLLTKLKDFLENEPTFEFLDLLDDESLPTNSDTILIIGQYKAAMDNYRSKNTKYQNWKTVENPMGNLV